MFLIELLTLVSKYHNNLSKCKFYILLHFRLFGTTDETFEGSHMNRQDKILVGKCELGTSAIYGFFLGTWTAIYGAGNVSSY